MESRRLYPKKRIDYKRALKTREGSSTLYYFVSDHLGSTALTLNQNGTLYSEIRYKPFGETAWSSAPAAPTRRRYTGQLQDFDLPTMQLYFYNARYYDPALARFTQADTIVPQPGNPQSFNRYSYVLNNPLKYTDPTGHFERDAVIEYLKQTHGKSWEYYLALWEQNTTFWDMLMDAEAGDVLLSNDGSYTFKGEGKTKLSGIYLSDEFGNPKYVEGCECNGRTLTEFAQGQTRSYYESKELIWYANIRWDDLDHKSGTFYLNPAMIAVTGTYTDWQEVGVNIAFATGGAGLGLLFGGMPAQIQVGIAAGPILMGAGGFPAKPFKMTATDQYLMFFSGGKVNGVFAGHLNPMWADYTFVYTSLSNLRMRKQ